MNSADTVKETHENALPIGRGGAGPGRPAGSKNKTTQAVRQALAEAVERHADDLSGWLLQVKSPARRIELFLKAAEFVAPKLTRASVALETFPPPERPRNLADFYASVQFVFPNGDDGNENVNAPKRLLVRAEA